MVDLLKKKEKGVDFVEDANTPAPGGGEGGIQHSLTTDPRDRRIVKILWTVGRHASWPTNLAVFQGPFLQAYRLYHIRKKATAAAHLYGDSENHKQETESKVMTVDIL